MRVDQKDIRYRASKLVEQRGISLAEALHIATGDALRQEAALVAARRNVFAEPQRRAQQEAKRRRKTGPIYTVNGSVVSKVISGGAPGQGKKA